MLRNFYNRVREKLTKKYRVELIDDVTLSQSRQYAIKPISVFWIAALLLMGVVGGTIVMFVYTPALHKLIPDYRDPAEVDRNEAEILEMVRELEAKQRFADDYEASIKVIANDFKGESPVLNEQRLDSIRQAQGADQEMSLDVLSRLQESDGENASQAGQQIAGGNSAIPVEKVAARSMYGLANLFPPIKGEVINPFDEASLHYGVDIVADENTLIRSVADGYVVMSEYSDANGWVIGVASKDNLITFYKHNSRLLKQAGTYVYAGEPVAVIGNSGENSTGMHLHLELWHKGRQLNPVDYIDFN